MSATAVQEFLAKVSEDSALQEELAKAMDADNDRQAVTDLAKAKGYDFTADELWQEIQARQAAAKQRQDSGELTEDELEAVAGGELVVATVASLTVISAAAGVGSLGYALGTGLGNKIKW